MFSGPDFRAYQVARRHRMRDDPHMGVKVLIVDDHAAFRSAARLLLEEDGFEVVGEAADGASALALVRELEPELVLLDVVLPDMSGLEVAEQLVDEPCRIVLTSSRARSDFGRRLRRSRALGFVSKDRLSREAIQALWESAS